MSFDPAKPYLAVESAHTDAESCAFELSEEEWTTLEPHRAAVSRWFERMEPDGDERAAQPAAAAAYDLALEIYEERDETDMKRSEFRKLVAGEVDRVINVIGL